MAIIAPAMKSGSLLALNQMEWGKYYAAVLNLLGSTGTILPFGDPNHGQPNATTFTTVGEEQVTFTWSEAPASFDTPLDLTSPDSFQGIIPTVTFNGTDEEADSPDITYWSRGDGSNDSPFSVGLWIKVTASASAKALLAKYGGGINEWRFDVEADETLTLSVEDESAGASGTRTSDAAVSTGVWIFVVATYDGTGGTDPMAGANCVIYVDGASVASTATTGGTYVAMENNSRVMEFAQRTAASFFSGSIAGGPLGPFYTQTELSADAVKRLYELGRAAMGL